MGPPSSEGTEAICRVPSGYFSQTPWYTLPDHLCRFRVRSIWRGYFLEPLGCMSNPIRTHNFHDPSHISRPTNINVVPIDYPLRARLRGRITLRRLALRRTPGSFGERASRPDRKSAVWGKRVSRREALGGRRNIKKIKTKK